jgi:L-threonylcarbamoyladenylate synthase
MPLIIGGISMIRFVAKELPPQAVKLMKRFWPGPLTIVLKAADALPASVTAGTGTIGVRLPGCPMARRFSNTLGFPITSTSANPSGANPAVSAKEVLEYFNGSIGALIDGGSLEDKKGSTIVDATGEKLVLIREGEIPSSEIF